MSDTIRRYNGLNLAHYPSSKVLPLSRKLFEDSGVISFFNYSRIFPNGDVIDVGLGDIWNEWLIRFEEKYLQDASLTTCRLNSGINYWRRNNNQHLSMVQEEARKDFNLDARIEFVMQDAIDSDIYHAYSFGSKTKVADKAYGFYGLHSAKILKFIVCFNKAAAQLIEIEDCKPDNRTHISNYQVDSIKNTTRNYAEELKAQNASLELTDREFEVIILYATGCTALQIAEILCKSERTIETHILHIHNKLGCRDRKSLHRYVADQGWTDLDRFFFNYIPSKGKNVKHHSDFLRS